MAGIPHKYLCKMGTYSITFDSSNVDVKVIDRLSVFETHLRTLRDVVEKSPQPRVIGFDIKRAFCKGNNISAGHDVIVICTSSIGLILHLRNDSDHAWLKNYMKTLNVLEICLVSPVNTDKFEIVGVDVRQLAARVVKKSSFFSMNVAEICDVVGVKYHGSATDRVVNIIEVDADCPILLTEEQVKLAMCDAYACQQICSKLLASL